MASPENPFVPLDPSDYNLSGSAAAETALEGIYKPLVGAGPHPDLTLAELNQRFDGTGTAPAHTFPTPQN
ncbi:hypothetical protein J4U02_gp101 [Mycobacterium phage Aziz]|uniref:Uncharacterized protein n=1 Tax=Mycobacterium phage Aziz TaxID=2762281 RepID=A0A7G8LHN9_9CAUD|nr:hypothetical protein J4U02_gp101 [Mycobacterium phage Aziz]ASR75949.1 hypothetical protein SEA_GENEVAB15_103 [Mycobacterium phage GenevaB15]QNJ56761.1 hypothetical protein SEA_AZIZ_101 [Mycobacterium phage Aziz]